MRARLDHLVIAAASLDEGVAGLEWQITVRDGDLATALTAIGLVDMNVLAGAPNLVAILDTPRGPVTLESKGL
jgi:hypothetical protein